MSIGPMQLANGLVSLLAAAMLAGLILNPRINEGLIVKIGLLGMMWGLIGTAYLTLSASHNWDAVWNAGLVLRALHHMPRQTIHRPTRRTRPAFHTASQLSEADSVR